MPFIILAYDETDADASARRMANREAHLAMVKDAVDAGEQIFGAALTDDSGKMIGSLMVMNFKTRAEVDSWLACEPYVKGEVWGKTEVIPCAVPELFSHLFKQTA